MNYCNFAKVIISRSTKDVTDVPSSENDKVKPRFSNTVSTRDRFQKYQLLMTNYPKMHMPYDQFRRKLPLLQKYVTENKYYKGSNKSGEKSAFLSNFSLQSWSNLPERKKMSHSLMDCNPCNTTLVSSSVLHTSIGDQVTKCIQKTEEALKDISSYAHADSNNGTGIFLNILSPVISEKLDVDLKSAVTKHFNLTEKQTNVEKRREKMKSKRENHATLNAMMSNEEDDVQGFLGTGKSYEQYNRERMSSFFENKSKAKERVNVTNAKIKEGKKKPKNHIGNLKNYSIDKKELLHHMRSLPSGSTVIWSSLAKRFNLSVNGKIPLNGGQVIKALVKENGIDPGSFNTVQQSTVFHGYLQRIRRAKKRLGYGLTAPASRPVRQLHTVIKKKINAKEINIGDNIAPKTYKTNKINKEGNLVEENTTVYGRKISLEKIRQDMLNEQVTSKVLRIRQHDYYQTLQEKDIQSNLQSLGAHPSNVKDEDRKKLQTMESTRHLKIWHDHSDILNHSYVCFMVSTLYDPAVFLTNEEYKQLNPNMQNVDVQSIVEKPHIYILGQSKSTDIDQLTYIQPRIDDILKLDTAIHHPSVFHPIYDVMRVFSGDGPARQFESGQQRGGNFSCLCGIAATDHSNIECALQSEVQTIEKRLEIFQGGIIWRRFSLTNPSPFAGLLKDDIMSELESRGVSSLHKSKPELQHNLQDILRGIQRPPALLTTFNESVKSTLNKYEIPACEPLHDIINVVQNIITELPSHIHDKNVQKEFENFSSTTVGDKNQIKGSDARLYAVKLTKFSHNQLQLGNITQDFFDLCQCLVTIISICYSHHESRTQRNILRLYNQCFLFAMLCKKIIGEPKKITSRKFYGTHFHTLTIHVPETYRLFCLRSLVPEQEERSFGDLRSISERTSNRQCGKVIDNCMVRFQSQRNRDDRVDSFRVQDTVISKQARQLPPLQNTAFHVDFVSARPTAFQHHCERIADYLLCGEGVWWIKTQDSIEFLDGPNEPETHLDGPLQTHFRSETADEIKAQLHDAWGECIKGIQSSSLNLPLKKIKIYKEGRLSSIFRNEENPVPCSTKNPVPGFTENQAPCSTENQVPGSIENPALGSTEKLAPSTYQFDAIICIEKLAPGSTENEAPGSTEYQVPGSKGSLAPGSTENTAPGSISSTKTPTLSIHHFDENIGIKRPSPYCAKPCPGSTENLVPGSTENPAPGSTKTPVPGSTEKPAPGSAKKPASSTYQFDEIICIEIPATSSKENPAPGSTETPAPGSTENPAPGSTENPAQGSTENQATSTYHFDDNFGIKKPVPSTKRPAPSTKRQSPSTKRPALSTKRPAPSTKRPAPSTKIPVSSTKKPALSIYHFDENIGIERPSPNFEKPSPSNENPSSENPAPSTYHNDFENKRASTFTGVQSKSGTEREGKKPVKRQLFRDESAKVSVTDALKQILGNLDIIADYEKYKRLHQKFPRDALLKSSFDGAQCKVEMALSAKHNNLKETEDIKLRKKVEKLLELFGVYYY